MVALNKKLIKGILILFICCIAFYFAYVFISLKIVGQFIGGYISEKGKSVIALNHFYSLMNIGNDSLHVFDTTSTDYSNLLALKSSEWKNHEHELLKDAFWIKPSILLYYDKFYQLPDSLQNLRLPVEFQNDTYGKRYFYKRGLLHWFLGTPGADGIWNDSLALNHFYLDNKLFLYRTKDDIMIKVPIKTNQR